VYLPAGASWRDAWTGEEYEGGQTVSVDAPLERIPLFLRDAAELPIAAAAQG
jgi:alpha-D-xyloside xylohydrolase